LKRRRLLLSPMGLRVLVVDAIQINQKMMARRLAGGELKELKWKVEFANTGEEAMQRLEGAGGGFDVIVMDENMQSADGVLTDTTKLIRSSEEGGEERTIIVGLSGNCTDEDKEAMLRSGQDLFWEKPAPKSERMLRDVARLWAERGKKRKRGPTV